MISLCGMCATVAAIVPQTLDGQASPTYLRCNILRCTQEVLMFKFIAEAIARFFAPALELIGELPPQALSRIASPF
jgi:hypothetical protein